MQDRFLEACYVFLSSGVTVDAGGFGITPDGHVHKIPGNNPEDYRQIEVGFAMARLAESVGDKQLRTELLSNATKLINTGRTAIENKLKSTRIGKAEAA